MLLQHALGCTRAYVVAHGGDELAEYQLQDLEDLSARRSAGEPMAYILGEREFYGRRFAVNPSVLIPRPETEHLVEAVIEHLPLGGTVWDLGTGSGAVAVTVALERADAFVHASDISPNALQTAKQNAETLGAKIKFACGSWFDTDVPSEKRAFDVIVSNPPYIEPNDPHLAQGDLRFEPKNALTDFSDGLSCIRALAEGAPKYLKAGGRILLEHGFDQGKAAREILLAHGFAEVETWQDLAGLDRITLGKYAK